MIRLCKYYFWHQWIACYAVAAIDVIGGLFCLATLGLFRIDKTGLVALRVMGWSLGRIEAAPLRLEDKDVTGS